MKKIALLLLLLAVIPTGSKALSTSDDILALVAMPLAVAAVSDVPGLPQDQLGMLVTTLNQANVPPAQFVHVIRYVPVGLVVQDNRQPTLVQYVQTQSSHGLRGAALIQALVQALTGYGVTPQLDYAVAPMTLVIQNDYIPRVVVERVVYLTRGAGFERSGAPSKNPHGGPPGQIKKTLGLQTGAEVVHGTKPGRQFPDGGGAGHGKGHGEGGPPGHEKGGKGNGNGNGKGKE
jgi:hypothetical protein